MKEKEIESRSVQRRKVAQQGKPAPQFDQIEKMAEVIREHDIYCAQLSADPDNDKCIPKDCDECKAEFLYNKGYHPPVELTLISHKKIKQVLGYEPSRFTQYPKCAVSITQTQLDDYKRQQREG